MNFSKTIGILVSTFAFLGAVLPAIGQNCTEYEVVTDARRSTLNPFNPSFPVCDDDIEPDKWYRFYSYAGTQISERDPPNTVDLFYCGTEVPMYIKGTNLHPTQDDSTVAVTTCANKGGGGDNCNAEKTAKIHRCPAVDETGSFYIYQLQPSGGCNAAYCAGEMPACDENSGQMWNGFECVDYYPTIIGCPSFTGPNTTGSGNEMQIYFTCSVRYNRTANDTNARFRITFIFDGSELPDRPPPYNQLPPFVKKADDIIEGKISVDLTEFYLRGRLGRHISCQVKTYWEGNAKMSKPSRATSGYKVAMESNSPTIEFDLSVSTQQDIVYQSTVPLTCFHCSKYPCYACEYAFPVKDTTMASDCYLVWRNGTTTQVVVQVKPNGRTTAYELEFTEYIADVELQNSESLWHGYKVPTTTVIAYIDANDYKNCSSQSDPHITAFDGEKHNSYLEGYFSIVSAEFGSHKLEIQTIQEKCNDGAACNCAIIVREFNTAYKLGFEFCGQWGTANRPIVVVELLSQDPPDGSEVTRDDTGRKYSIRMASGLRVEVNAQDPWLSFVVHLPPEYHNKTSTSSQCGNSDGKPNTPLDPSAYRLTDDANNYFITQPECDDRYYFPEAKDCDCDSSSGVPEVLCSSIEQNLEQKSKANIPFGQMFTTGRSCNKSASRHLAARSNENSNADYMLDPTELYRPFIFDPHFGENLNLTWPTPKGKEEAEVEQYCRTQLQNSPVYADCVNHANIEGIITNCKEDVQIADDFVSANAYRDSLEEECVNIMIWKGYQNNETTASDEFTAVYNKICPNQCSDHGTCAESICTCDQGFVGADCGIDQAQPPHATGIIRQGLCDIQERPCATISVYGAGLYPSPNLACQFKDLKSSSAKVTNGTFVTSNEVRCSVPESSGERPAVSKHDVSLSNDGTLYGNASQFLVFDSVCVQCGQDKVCTQKTDACLISERCYANEAMKDDITCSQCVPSTSTSLWTDMPVEKKLGNCSRQCDFAAQTRQSVCSVNNQVVYSEPVLCKQSDCPAIPEEKSEGVIITMSKEDLAKVMLTPTLILSEVADVVNHYCSQHATECCNSVGVPGGSSLSDFTSLELCPYGAGYPEVNDGSAARVKVIVKIFPQEVQQRCAESSSAQKSTSGEVAYANRDIIFAAVSTAEADIEKALQIDILSVTKDDDSNSGVSVLSSYFASILTVGIIFALSTVRLV